MSHAAPERGPRVKICGLTRKEDARLADALGADFLGVVLTAGFGRSVDADVAAAVVEDTGARVVAVLVDETVERAAALAERVGAAVVQLHGGEPPDVLAALRDLGDWTLWKSVRARARSDLEAAVERYGDVADGLLVEGWRDGVVGGGGASLEIDPSAVRSAIPADLGFVLAGGLTPGTVGEAAERFRPDVVDVSSGVEARLREKDPRRLEAFIRAARVPHGRRRASPTSERTG